MHARLGDSVLRLKCLILHLQMLGMLFFHKL